MRLLNVKTMRLEELFGSNIPKYAILSHTWGEEEVGFQDIHRWGVSSMRGYTKIKYACLQAQLDEHDYIWIDTCCIDKSSSSELSEAINSMFQWYQKSTVCYAFLEDVLSIPSAVPSGGAGFEKSRWFSRGWTLQELLAPTKMRFYGANWTYLGHKVDLAPRIAHSTGISERVLLWPLSLSSFSVATRMCWASKRETTRVEDLAYCLLGIFGVNMPLLYGEGLNAFTRFQEELIKSSDDESLFAWDEHTPLESDSTSQSGILAPHPLNFRNSGGIVPLRSKSRTDPYAMTNKGLQIRMPLMDYDVSAGHCLGVLNCQYEDDFSRYVALPLVETSVALTYQRAKTGACNPRAVPSSKLSNAEIRTIYIRKSEATSAFDLKSLYLLRCESLRRHGYEVTFSSRGGSSSAYWNPVTQILRVYDRSVFSKFFFSKPGDVTNFVLALYPQGDWRRSQKNTSYMSISVNTTDGTEEQGYLDFLDNLDREDLDLGDPLQKSNKNFIAVYPDRRNHKYRRDEALNVQIKTDEGRSSPFRMTAAIGQEERMEQNIWVIDISLEPVAEADTTGALPLGLDIPRSKRREG